MKLKKNARWVRKLAFVVLAVTAGTTHAALLALQPFTNTVGAAILGSGGGFGFSGVWQTNSSLGVATNTSYALNYTDSASNTLATSGGAGFFQGLTSASSAMQPIRVFNFSRGTTGTDGTATWISFLVHRTGPTGTLSGNPYGRGANVPHDLNALQKLAVGNGSGATSNTVALIPQGSGSNIKGATNIYGGVTNFVVVRIDHVAGAANDNAYLFVNPLLGVEPSTSSAGAVSLNAFDYSFDRLRVFAGGQSSPQQPYVEMVLDEYRIGETYADVTTIVSNSPPILTGPLIITNASFAPNAIVLAGTGGSNDATYFVLAGTNLFSPVTNWAVIATNTFDANGNFVSTNPTTANEPQQFYRLFTGSLPGPPAVAPTITTDLTNQTVLAGTNASFIAAASETPLRYQWYFNTNTAVANATNSSLTISNAQPANAGGYFLIVTNAAGSATSAVATLTVNVPPFITTQPTSLSVTVSNNATFTFLATGTAPLRYQWYFNTNTALAAATNSSLTITNAQFTNAGAYSAIVTNNFGAVTSSFVTLTVTTNPVLVPGAYFVATNGSDTNPGTFASPFKTISKGLSVTSTGGVVYVRSGVYALSSKLSLSGTGGSVTNMKRLWAYPGEFPVIDSSAYSGDGVGISGRFYHLKGFTVMLAEHNGINISGHTNIVESCTTHDNGNTGLHITGGNGGTTHPAYNLILNCDSYLNFDPSPNGIDASGGNADGFSAKWDLGVSNVFSGCRAWLNSDDGWDLWMGTSTVVIENCWAFRNGTNYWGDPLYDGNGNGFKLGGNGIGTPHIVRNCVSFDNTITGSHGAGRGYDENNNFSGQTLYNCIAYRNTGDNYHFNNTVTNGQHVVRNCISYVGNANITSGTRDHNSWNGFTVSNADFQSLDASMAITTAPRNADGSLPVTTLFRLNAASPMVDAGIDVGLPYNGSAPDLGAFETGP